MSTKSVHSQKTLHPFFSLTGNNNRTLCFKYDRCGASSSSKKSRRNYENLYLSLRLINWLISYYYTIAIAVTIALSIRFDYQWFAKYFFSCCKAPSFFFSFLMASIPEYLVRLIDPYLSCFFFHLYLLSSQIAQTWITSTDQPYRTVRISSFFFFLFFSCI